MYRIYSRISRLHVQVDLPKFVPQYEEKIQDPRISRPPFSGIIWKKNLLHATRNNEITPDHLLYQRFLLLTL